MLTEVDWLRPATSGFGNPGSFNVPSLERTVADPGCGRYEGLLQQLVRGQRDLPFRLRPATHGRAQRATCCRPGGGLPGARATGYGILDRIRLRPQRHQPRRLPQFPRTQHARGTGLSPGQSPWRGCVLPGTVHTAMGIPRRSTTTEHETLRFAVGCWKAGFSGAANWDIADGARRQRCPAQPPRRARGQLSGSP